jgi:branched-chain amino acid transport system substrate-binding protein
MISIKKSVSRLTSMLVVFLALLSVVSCATGSGGGIGAVSSTPKREAAKASAAAQKELKGAQANLRQGENKKAVQRLEKLIKQNPESDVADSSHMLMANLYFTQAQYAEAYAHYAAVVNGPASSHETAARLGAARCLNKLGKQPEAAKALANSDAWQNVTPDQRTEINRLRIDVLTNQKDYIGALGAALSVSKEQGQDYFESTRFSPDDLKQISNDPKYGTIESLAKYRYALILADQKDYSGARSALQDVARMAPGTELADRANRFVQQIDARNKVDPHTIGVVLPLSGPNASIGYKALRGIQLGLGLYGSNQSTGFRLAVVDSEGNVDGARRGIERLVQEDNVIAIIGGLQSKTATVEAARAQEFGVPTIMLSQKSGITAAGESIFRNALTSQMQVQELVDIAMKQLGYKNFAVMYPNDAYGTEYANLFWDEVKSHGGEITAAQTYDPKETDFRSHVQRLAGTYYLDDRAEELRVRQAEYAQKNPKKSLRNGGPSIEDILPPVVDFDAVFIPDEARAVGQIAPSLAYDNVKGVRLLGTNIWNSPRFIQRGQRFVEGAIFVDSVLTNDPSFTNSPFYLNFKSAFNEDPGLTEIQAYDSALIVRQLIAKGETTRIGLQQAMANLQNFPGALGNLSVTPDREIRRPMTAFTVSKGQFTPFASVPQ